MSEMPSDLQVSFLCDQNLGRLAKWLRIMGYDTEYMRVWNTMMIENAISAGRIVLTRNRKSAQKKNFILIESDHVQEQIKQVDRIFRLQSKARWFTRCNVCNEVLMCVKPDFVMDLVPEYVSANHDNFAHCPRCSRIYWRGTHPPKIMKTIKSILTSRER